ncbi:MAG: helix-turn-helix domain-containing protein [Myxococcales bacterium]|jgi:AcrR family transcriptional regulator
MKSAATRKYRQTARAEAVRARMERLQRAAVALWREKDIDEVTLAEIAERAGVSVQTLMRRFGSKQGLLDACLEQGGTEIELLRNRAEPGDVEGALAILFEHYELDGDAVLRTLQVEGRSEAAARILAAGRRHHRQWCARVFAPYLPRASGNAREARIDAFVAATDVYVWKLLRRDLKRSRAQAVEAMGALVEGLARGEGDARGDR